MPLVTHLVLLSCLWSAPAVTWSECPALEVASIPATAHVSCANYSVPLDWDSTDSQTCEVSETPTAACITFFVKRISINSVNFASQSKKPNLWMLAGGPGGSGGQLLQGLPGIPSLLNDFDLLVPDHRGLGHSTPLECPLTSLKQVLGDAACQTYLAHRYGDSMHFYTTTNAAKDHAYAMKDVGAQNFMYGISYGSYLANRVLLVANESDASYPAAVVMDGVCASDSCRSLGTVDSTVNEAGLKMLPLCDQSAFCRAQFPQSSGVTNTYLTLFREVKEGNNVCTQKLKKRGVNVSSYVMAGVLGKLAASWKSRPLVMATIYRMRRCTDSDLVVLATLFTKGFVLPPAAPGSSTPDAPLPPDFPTVFLSMLGLNIEASEMFQGAQPVKNRSCEAVDEIARQGFFVKGSSYLICEARKSWNRYPLDKYVGRYAAPKKTTILLLNGVMDPVTPVEWATHAASSYQELNVNVTLITVPLALHGTIFNAPVLHEDGQPSIEDSCGIQLMQSFLRDPSFEANTTCLSTLAPIDWKAKYNVTKDTGTLYFGTADIWGEQDPPSPGSPGVGSVMV